MLYDILTPAHPRCAADEQSRRASSETYGDLPKAVLRDKIGQRSRNPQHPAELSADRQAAGCRSEEILAHPSYRGRGNGESGAVR